MNTKTKIYETEFINEFAITQIQVFNKYTRDFFFKYIVCFNNMNLGSTYIRPNENKLKQIKKDIEDNFIETKNYCDLDILTYN